MSIMASESEIRNAIEGIRSTPGTFQRLAEDFMCIKYAGEYVGLRPQGRKANDQTIKGYPDAYARLPSGHFLIVEVTVGDWRSHLNDDLVKLSRLGHGAVAEIAFFTMQDADLLLPQSNANANKRLHSEEYYRQELQKLGIPAAGIRFFFMNQIVRELRQPQYAKLLNVLGLPVSVTPFENIDLLPGTNMEPSREEYKTKVIVNRRRLNKVKRCINSHTVSMIVGQSGVGKTTLALNAAHQWAAHLGRTAMYMDFRDSPDAHALVDSIIRLVTVYGDSNTLFIIDNTHHLPYRLLAQIENAFHRSENRPKLLLISHFAPPEPAENPSSDTRIKRALITVSLEIPDIQAAYHFICRRLARSTGFYTPDSKDLEEWIEFAPDMLTFCMALTNEKQRIISNMRPNLSAEGTHHFINEHYLEHCSEDARKILASIATLATFEMSTSEMSLPGKPTQKLLGLSLTIKTPTKEGGYFRYKLAHDKLGRLILEALEADPKLLLDEILDRDPFQAGFWVRQQLDRERKDPAQKGIAAEVLRKIDNSLWHFSKQFLPSYVQRIASLYKEANVPLNFWNILPARLNEYIDRNDDFLMGIPGYLSHGNEHPELVHACWEKLEQTNAANRFSNACQLAPAKSLGTLLLQAERQGPETLDWLVPAMTSKPIASAMARRLSAHDPQVAENTLNTVQRLAPSLYGLLRNELRKDELLLPFLHNLLRSYDSATLQWLQRPILLELTLNKDTDGAIALAFATKRTRALRCLIRGTDPGNEAKKLINRALDIIFSIDNMEKTVRYADKQLALVMECFADTRSKDCCLFIEALHRRGQLVTAIHTMKPDTLITTWTATLQFRSNSKARGLIKSAIFELLDQRLNSAHPPRGVMLDNLNTLAALTDFAIASASPQSTPLPTPPVTT